MQELDDVTAMHTTSQRSDEFMKEGKTVEGCVLALMVAVMETNVRLEHILDELSELRKDIYFRG